MSMQVVRGGALMLSASRRFLGSSHRASTVRCMATQAPKYHTLQYEYAPDILEKRGPHREGHLDAIRNKHEEGKMVMAGAVGDPIDGGVLIFQNCTKEEVEEYAVADPYVIAGLVAKWSVKPYLTVVSP